MHYLPSSSALGHAFERHPQCYDSCTSPSLDGHTEHLQIRYFLIVNFYVNKPSVVLLLLKNPRDCFAHNLVIPAFFLLFQLWDKWKQLPPRFQNVQKPDTK